MRTFNVALQIKTIDSHDAAELAASIGTALTGPDMNADTKVVNFVVEEESQDG